MASGHDKTWDSQTVGEKIRNFFRTFWVWSDKSIYLFAISNILCLVQQLLNTTLVSSLPCFPFISSRRRPLVLVGEAGSKWDSPILIIACVSPEQQHFVCVMSLCVFVFIWAGIVRKHRDYQTVSQACLSLYHCVSEYPTLRMGTLDGKHRPLNG